ncbi:hypothetical protein HG535_0A06660 [Zygotorulaspora mrakii]|uniref:Uncharacterized protein n=1 Tax=Zygotorulaspora mrakii TaxID=42260 RepID=A0A7H9AXB2_ZYGMR|nr:uncharacterized protein HG535_0A06660 [Zygotorulaspora mrakii]QLG70724.1 hypothetical protein HG535_0A06660 [Zygotorulaspora mrakii]
MTLSTEPLDQEDQDAIILDARAGDLESLKEIFSTLIHPSLITSCECTTSRSSPLHMAAGNGHLEVVRYLLESVKSNAKDASALKCFVNKKNETGNTALHWASLNDKLEVVELLCNEYEADPFIRNSFGHDAIFEAENAGNEAIENFYLKKYDVEPEDNLENAASTVQISEGTEIEQITKEAYKASEELRESTKKLSLNDDN